MIEEIIYTSAVKGLKQGSRGFCTVASTAGMGANMAERLESMSGYRHAFPLNDPKASLNPVNYSHVTTRMAGRKLNVISRIADAGQDYSGRTNKLAHHVVVDDMSSLPAGPARVVGDTSSIISTWDGKVTTRPARVLPCPQIPPKVKFSAWQSAAADNGWGGYVAEQLLASKAPVNVIFPAGTDTLSLVTEVLDLIPIPQRWSITFSTYFTKLLAGTECQLRFYLDGTTEATALRNDARALKVDLAGALPSATGGALVETARSGILEFKQATTKKQEPARRLDKVANDTSSPTPSISDDELDGLLEKEVETGAARETTYRLQELVTGRPSAKRSVAPPPVSRLDAAFRKSESRVGVWIIGTVVVLLLCGVGLAVFFLKDHLPLGGPTGQQSREDAPPTVALETTPKDSLSVGDSPVDPVQTSSPKAENPRGKSPPEKTMATDTAQKKKRESVDPFEGKRPFDKLRDTLRESSGTRTWEVAGAGSSHESEALQLTNMSPDSLSISCDNEKISVTPQASTDGHCEWLVATRETALGSFLLNINESPVPSTFHWKWHAAVAKSTEPLDGTAMAIRVLRSNQFLLQAAPTRNGGVGKTDSLKLALKEKDWTPFSRYTSLNADNLRFSLNVPPPGSLTEEDHPNLNSDDLFIEAMSISDVHLSPFEPFSGLLSEQDVVLMPPRTEENDTAHWNVGLVTQGGDPQDAAQLGSYVVSQVGDGGVVKLSFTWAKNVNPQDAAPLQWLPIDVEVDGDSARIFPRGPERIQVQELINLGQSDQMLFPDIDGKKLPFRLPEEGVGVWGEVVIHSQQHHIRKRFTLNGNNDVDIAKFRLATPFILQSTEEEAVVGGLGGGVLRVGAAPTEKGCVPTSLKFLTEISVNRLAPFYAQQVSVADLTDRKYWTQQRTPISMLYQREAAKFVATAEESIGVIPRENRCAITKLSRFDELEAQVKTVNRALKKQEEFLNVFSQYRREQIPDQLNDEMKTDLLEARKIPEIVKAMKDQRKALKMLQEKYSSDQFNNDQKTIQRLQDTVATLKADVDVFLEFSMDTENTIRLYVVTTSPEETK
jgi:hypothetical protein